MRITQEADYALRIVRYLSKTRDRIDAGTIALNTAVSPRFATKILRKLMLAGIVRSYKGASGGYSLAKKPENITLLDIITTIDGDIYINKCIKPHSLCTFLEKSGEKNCSLHNILSDINDYITKQLSKVNFANIDTFNDSSS